ncbi:MAG: 2Fe-2S iron-sulfur cluster-binding protein [Treponema sp.]|nr:2Fe-2S iron-sulfur cluster-binding protein [Treponema sp.]
MKFQFLLNGDKTVIEANADDTLRNVLRRNGCLSIKKGCSKGQCGSCSVLLNGKISASCKIPVSLAQDDDIITLEYFSRTEEYLTIMEGFEKAGIHLCGYCNAGKIFTAFQLLNAQKKLTRDEIKTAVSNLPPCCTELDTLVNGIIYAININNQKEKKHE